RSTIPALASTCLMSILLLLAMSFQERVERLGVEQPVRVSGTEPQLERTGFRRCVDQLDLLDQPIQPQAHRGVRDPVLGGEVLKRPPGQQESLQEAQILLAQVLNPRFCHVPTPFQYIYLDINIIDIITKVKFTKNETLGVSWRLCNSFYRPCLGTLRTPVSPPALAGPASDLPCRERPSSPAPRRTAAVSSRPACSAPPRSCGRRAPRSPTRPTRPRRPPARHPAPRPHSVAHPRARRPRRTRASPPDG